MATFKISYAKTARNEGGYTCVHEDNGNWTGGHIGSGQLIGTNYGISAPVLVAYLKRIPTRAEMQNLSPATAMAIYEKNYWAPIHGNEIKSQAIADSIYDSAVNMGPCTAVKLAQRALNLFESGLMDAHTLQTLNNSNIHL